MKALATQQDLIKIITPIHFNAYKLCKKAFKEYFKNSSNIAIFSQSDEEYVALTKLREQICEPSSNLEQKYYKLLTPVIISTKGDVLETQYKYLYIRKPDDTDYSKYLGDIDFYLPKDEYAALKQMLIDGGEFPGAEIYDRPGWDMIQISNPAIKSVAYVSTEDMT